MSRPIGSTPAPSGSGLRSEHDLLLACARADLDTASATRIRHLTSGDIDWPFLVRNAARHFMLPLVYHHLHDTCPDAVPDPVMGRLRKHSFVNAGNSLILAKELLDVIGLLERSGIEAVPYKGPALAASVYGNLSLRQFTDLDVLVSPKDAIRAKQLLIGRGYEPEFAGSADQDQAQLRARAGYFFRLDRRGPMGDVTLELHWRIPSTFPLEFARFSSRLESMALLDRTVRHFAPEDLILLLCVHGLKHAWSRLIWLCDVAGLIRSRPDLDWDSAVDQAIELGGLRVLLLGCAIARDLLQVELPDSVSARAAADRVVCSMAAAISHRLLDRPIDHVGVVNNWRVRERWRDRRTYCAGLVTHLIIPTVSDELLQPLPPGFHFAHYVLRPVRVASRLIRRFQRTPV